MGTLLIRLNCGGQDSSLYRHPGRSSKATLDPSWASSFPSILVSRHPLDSFKVPHCLVQMLSGIEVRSSSLRYCHSRTSVYVRGANGLIGAVNFLVCKRVYFLLRTP